MYNFFSISNYLKGVIIALVFSAIVWAQPVPVSSTPLNGSMVYYTSPLISWYFNESSVGLTYQLQVSYASDFSVMVLDTSNLPVTSLIFNAETGTTYYWRVRSFNGSSYSGWCSTFSFSTTGSTTTYSISAASGINGTISPAGVSTVNNHGSKTYTFTANSGYHVRDVVVDGVSKGPLASYTFNNVTTNHSISVSFSNLWFITSAAGPNGTISPSGIDSVTNYGSKSFIVTPNSNYHISAIKVDDSVVGVTSPYNLTNITSNHTVLAEFAKNTYPITATANSGGTITPAGITTVNFGDTLTYTITPSPGYSIAFVLVDDIYAGKISSYTFNGVSTFHSIRVYFSHQNDIYISPSGDDITGNGTQGNPYKTMMKAQSMSTGFGDVIHLSDGSYSEHMIVGVPNLTVIGSGNSFLSDITLIGDSITFKDINLVSTLGGPMFGFYSFNPQKKLTLDNVNISGYQNGLIINECDNVTITNSSVTLCSQAGMVICNSQNLTLTNTNAINNKGLGIYLKGIDTFLVENVNCSSNNLVNQILTIFGSGLSLVNVKNGLVNNVITNDNYGAGILLGPSDLVTISNVTTNNNGNFGLLVLADITFLSDPFPVATFPLLTSVANLKVNGTDWFTNNKRNGILLWGTALNNIIAPVFDGKITMNDSLSLPGYSAVGVLGNVYNPVFKGFRVKYNFAAFVIQGLSGNINQPVGVKINNCVFYQHLLNPTISLTGGLMSMSGFSSNNVDARNNNFLNAISYQDIENYIVDSLDAPLLGFGRIDYSGSTFGNNPSITINGNPTAYRGGSYFLNVDLKAGDVDYYWLRGTFTYDTTKLEYQGFMNDGLINNATWYITMTEDVHGTITYTAFGFVPINTNGTLFRLNMKVLATATGAATIISGNPSLFYGNLVPGAFTIIPGVINYTDPPGVFQALGDVTLDGVVNDFDFWALLMHVNGVALLTAPQALINADYNMDGFINQDDVNALFAFLHPAPSPSPVAAIPSGSVRFNNVKYNPDGSATIPVSITGAANISSFELLLNYDATKIDYQAFSSAVEAQGYFVQAFKTGEGKAKFVFNTQNAVQGNFHSGDITLKFKSNSVPVGSVVQTNYTLNGKNTQKGPDVKFGQDGVTVVNENKPALPVEFNVYQNYPNPFNPSTTISYAIPVASDVSVTIYDLLGKVVKVLVNQPQEAGIHNVIWNADNSDSRKVANGIYFYKVSAGSYTAVKKMILLK